MLLQNCGDLLIPGLSVYSLLWRKWWNHTPIQNCIEDIVYLHLINRGLSSEYSSCDNFPLLLQNCCDPVDIFITHLRSVWEIEMRVCCMWLCIRVYRFDNTTAFNCVCVPIWQTSYCRVGHCYYITCLTPNVNCVRITYETDIDCDLLTTVQFRMW